jgi:hypothetical protein
MNCCGRPAATLGLTGVTVIDVRAADSTVRVVLPLTLPSVPEIVVVPAATLDARPPAAMVAAAVFVELQTTWVVRSWFEPSVYVPVAVNCWPTPAATLGLTGVTAIDVSAAGSTVSVVLPLTLPSVAEIVVVPAASVDARPPAAMVAAVVFVDAQTTCVVRSCVELSE